MNEKDMAQDTLLYSVSLSATVGHGQYSAFWMQSNTHGLNSLSPHSGSLRMQLVKPATRPNRWYDYDAAVDIVGTLHSTLQGNPITTTLQRFPVVQGNNGSFIIHRCYAHARLYVFDLSAGVMPITDGTADNLSIGSLLLSNNAPSMPALRIGIDQWTAIPGLFGYAQIKGGIVHAWLTDYAYNKKVKLHYKHIGIQIGGKLPINLSYEFHHTAQWGGYTPSGKDLGNDWYALKNACLAQSGGYSYNEQFNAQGNHLGSQLIGLTAKGKQWSAKLYWQNLIEDNFNFIGRGQNLPDGRWGITVKQTAWSFINHFTLEYICTADQSGPLHDQDGIIYAGGDNYYCNGIYREGWNYYLRSLGIPLITSPIYNDDGSTQTLNNRVKAWHIGVGGDICGFEYKLLATHVRNWGRYNNSDWYIEKNHNTALLLDIQKHVKKAWDLQFGIRMAADIGTQWGNQFSMMCVVTKQGLITTYK